VARLTPEQRRSEILQATLRVIGRNGFSATTTREVAREAGVQPGLLHHYFDTHEALLAEAFDLAAAQDLTGLRAAVQAGRTPLDKLRRFLRYYGPTKDDPLVLLWVDAWSEAPRNEQLRQTADRLNRAWVSLLGAIVREGRADGSFRCGQPVDVAWTILSLLDGLAIQLAVSGAVTPARARRLVGRHVEDQLGLPAGALRARR
jgi:AcrR family transcriptional regulator